MATWLRMARGLALAPIGAVTGCGFKLRQSADLPFATIYNGLPQGSGLATEFGRQIRIAGGTNLVANRPDADGAVLLVSENRDKEAVSFSPSGRPREYELRYRAVFRVTNRENVEVMPPTEILLRRYITTTDVELLAEQLEEEYLYREMQTDMVQQLMRRLAAVEPIT